MKAKSVLNLYAGIGGNRKLWSDVKVTAVEIIPKIANTYKNSFPDDVVIVADAHQYLLNHFKEYDFIWSSPPCVSHSVTNFFLNSQGIIRYPDIRLYEEILFLKAFFKGKWCVENVKSYYEPLIKPYVVDRHYIWSNFYIPSMDFNDEIGTMNRAASKKCQDKAIKSQLIRNCVKPEIGLYILDCAFKGKQEVLK